LTRQLQERLSLCGTIVAILAFGITYGKTVDPVAALGAVGIAYLLLAPPFLIFIWREELKASSSFWKSPLVLCSAFLLWWIFLAWDVSSKGAQLHSFHLLAVGGFAVVVAPPCLVAFSIIGYRERHKTCPECANDVLSAARVCQYCGYRWEPPLPSPHSSEQPVRR
jgi:hypothetical protein